MPASAEYHTSLDTNINLSMTSAKLVLDNLALNYEARHEPGTKHVVDSNGMWRVLGCRFGRYGVCGGWDKWDFLAICISNRQNAAEVTRTRLMDDIFMLERSPSRAMAELLWTAEDGTAAGYALKIVKMADYPVWAFAEMACEGEAPLIQQIRLWYFNGPDASPAPEREYWISARSGDYNMGTWKDYNVLKKRRPAVVMQTNDCGLVIHIRNDPVYADYCGLLVYLPEETAVSYDYLGIHIQPRANIRRIHFAFGYSKNSHYSQVIPKFLTRDCQAIPSLLRSMNWTPTYDFHAIERIVRELDKLAAQRKAGQVFTAYDYVRMRASYKKFRTDNNVREIIRLSRTLERLYDEVLAAAMRELLIS